MSASKETMTKLLQQSQEEQAKHKSAYIAPPSSKPPFLRTPFNYDRLAASNEHGLECKDETRTQQHYKDECDINVLFARYLDTGEMPLVTEGLMQGDFTGEFNFMEMKNAVRRGEEVFDQLPAKIKNRFENNPQSLIEFLQDPENRLEAEKLGLVKPPEPKPAPAPENLNDKKEIEPQGQKGG